MLSKRTLILNLAIFLLAVLFRIVPGPRTVDDAFITFRYAQNILDHQGMVYNPGERILGTTTPLYTIVLSAIGSLTGGSSAPFPWIAVCLNAIFDGMTCILLIALAESLGYRRAGLALASIWAIAPMSVTFAIGGMETSLFVLLMTGTFYFYSIKRPVASGFFASLSLITRPDALLFILPLALARFIESLPPNRFHSIPFPISRSEVAALILPSAIWFGYATFYFGSPIPQSIVAKADAYRLATEAGLIRLLQHYATPFLGQLTFGTGWIIIGIFLFPVLFGLGTLLLLRQNARMWAVFVFPWLYLAAYSIANPLIFRWYLTPPLPIYFLGIFLGGERIARDVRSKIPMGVLIIASVLFTLNGWTLHPDHGPTRPAPEMAFIKLELLYEKVGRNLASQLGKSQVLAAGDIGALGYFSHAQILDTVGLISPKVARYYPLDEAYYVINYAVAPALILDEMPDFLVILEVYGRNGVLINPLFNESYQLEETLDTDIYGSKGMLVFERISSK